MSVSPGWRLRDSDLSRYTVNPCATRNSNVVPATRQRSLRESRAIATAAIDRKLGLDSASRYFPDLHPFSRNRTARSERSHLRPSPPGRITRRGKHSPVICARSNSADSNRYRSASFPAESSPLGETEEQRCLETREKPEHRLHSLNIIPRVKRTIFLFVRFKCAAALPPNR